MAIDVAAVRQQHAGAPHDPAQRLAALLDEVSRSTDATAAMRSAAEHAARAIGAPYAAVTCGTRTVSTGPPPDARDAATMTALSVPLDLPIPGCLRVLRPTDAMSFTAEDAELL